MTDFFNWFTTIPAESMRDKILKMILLYALHSDSDLDAEGIYYTLSPNPKLKEDIMSVAEKLIAEGHVKGRVEGRVEGQRAGSWIGQIQLFEEFLSQPVTSSDALSELTIEELESRHRILHQEYQLRFKS